MAKITQSAFTQGEIDPALHKRIDIDQYYRALKTCLNFFIHPQGGASNRAGTEMICEVQDSDKATRTIEFEFSSTDTYALEFGDLYMRVVRNGAQVTVSGLSAYAGGTTYDQGDLVSYSGVNYYSKVDGNIGNQPDISPTQWYALTGSIFEIPTPYTEAQLFDLQYVQSSDIITIVHPSHAPAELYRTADTGWVLADVDFGPSIAAPTALLSSSPGAGYNYVVTAVAVDSYEESEASTLEEATIQTSTLTWTGVSGALYYNIYKELDGIYGLIGRSADTSFTDATLAPDKTATPSIARTPFSGADNYPSTVNYHQQRIIYGGTTNEPKLIEMSQVGSFHNMNTSSPLQDDDAISVTIDSNTNDQIKHIVTLKELTVLTGGANHLLTTYDNAFIFSNLRIKKKTSFGANNVRPVDVGDSALYVQDKGRVVRDIVYDDAGNFSGSNRSIFSAHLFKKYGIVDWAFATTPDSIVWCVLEDGTALGFTYMLEQEVFAWHRHTTDGQFESVCVVSEGDEDAVYFVVKRTIGGVTKRFIERLHTRNFDDVEDCFFVDCGLSLDDPKTISGATQADPVVITATSHGFSNGDLVDIVDVTGMTELNGNRYQIANVSTHTFELVDEIDATDIDGTGFTAYVSGGEVRKAVTTVSGLGHLEGETVTGLADGNVIPDSVVTSGAITLGTAASRIHVGLSYNCDLETLEPPAKKAQGVKKSVSRVIMGVNETRGLWAGPDGDHLVELKQRAETDGSGPIALHTGELEITIDPSWKTNGRVFIRQYDPLPATILSLTPDTFLGG